MPSKVKAGKVLRVDELTYRHLLEKKRRGEQFTSLLRRLLGLPLRSGEIEKPPKYVLPSDLHSSIEEARGAAVLKAVKTKQKAEDPIIVREVI